MLPPAPSTSVRRSWEAPLAVMMQNEGHLSFCAARRCGGAGELTETGALIISARPSAVQFLGRWDVDGTGARTSIGLRQPGRCFFN
jgi:hypothetical protein